MFFLHSGEAGLPCGLSPAAEDGGFGASPRAMGLADGGAGGAGAFPGRCLGARAQAASGGDSLPPREAVALRECVEQHEAEELADAGPRVQQLEGRGVMGLRGVDDGAFDVAQQCIVGGDQRELNGDALWHRRIGTARGASGAVAVVGAFFAKSREGILAVGMVDMGQECAAWAGQGHAAAQEVVGRAHLGRRAIGRREHPAAQEDGDFMGVARVIVGLATRDGLHREGMTEDTRETVCSPAVSKPVPRNHACGRQDDLIAAGGAGLEKRLWGSGPVPGPQRCTSLVEDAHGHGPGV
jgi:hypothetical protein